MGQPEQWIISKREPAETQALMYLILLAYPSKKDKTERADAFDACRAFLIRQNREEGQIRAGKSGVSRRRPQKDDAYLSSEYATIIADYPERDMWNKLNLVDKRLRRRQWAAEMWFHATSPRQGALRRVPRPPLDVQRDRQWIRRDAIWPMPDGFHGTLGPKPVAATHLTLYSEPYFATAPQLISAGAARFSKASTSKSNFRRQVWSQSALTVLHMAIAFRSVVIEARTGEVDELIALLIRPAWASKAIRQSQLIAASWRKYYAHCPAFADIDPADFMSLRISDE